jgi:hypothetical protein
VSSRTAPADLFNVNQTWTPPEVDARGSNASLAGVHTFANPLTLLLAVHAKIATSSSHIGEAVSIQLS